MPYDDDGFTPKTPAEITAEYEDDAKDIFDIVNFSVGSVLWQISKIHQLDRYEYETLLETASKMMSISDAEGIFLDKHGIEAGLTRRGETNAQGYVDVTANISGVPITIPAGTTFSSSRNSYTVDNDTDVPYEIVMTKTITGESYDYFPSTVLSVGAIVEIVDENNTLIPSSIYLLDPTYKNNIHWLASSASYIIANEQYTVRVSGNVTKQVEVTSTTTGSASNAEVGEVTSSPDFPTFTITNSSTITGGADQESDLDFKNRLLSAKRRNFTLGKVKSIAEEIRGVRSAKVKQDRGVDQTSISDWDNASIIGWRNITGTYPTTSQSFVPGSNVMSLGAITLSGIAVNSPPDLLCGLRLSTSPTGTTNYKTIGRFRESDLDPTVTGAQDINITMKFNSMDLTKTYQYDLWLDTPQDSGLDLSINYWKVALTDEGYRSDSRGDLLYYTGMAWVSQGTGIDLAFKTWYNGAGYTVTLAPEDGYGFSNLSAELDSKLDYIDGEGYSPIGIQYTIVEANVINVDIRGYIFITELADFTEVRSDIFANIESYLEGLLAGENVVYSRIEYEIMRHPQVWKQTNLEIKRSNLPWDPVVVNNQRDIYIADDEIADLGTRSIQLGAGTPS